MMQENCTRWMNKQRHYLMKKEKRNKEKRNGKWEGREIGAGDVYFIRLERVHER